MVSFLGNYECSNAMASVNIANPFIQFILGVSFVICTGTLSYIGRTLGEKNKEKAQSIFKTSVIATLVCSCMITFIGFLFHNEIAQFFGANVMLLSEASRYIMIVSSFAPIISFMLLFGFMQRLIERLQLYLIVTICCLVGNIIMNSDGIGSIISCNYGARKLNRVKMTLKTAISLNFMIGVGFFWY